MRRFIKYIASIMLIIFVFTNTIPASASEVKKSLATGVTEGNISDLTKSKIATGSYPFVSGNAFRVNTQIGAVIEERIKEATTAKATEINFSLETKESGDTVSLLIKSKISSPSSAENIDTVVYDNSKAPKELMTITHELALNKNGISIANKTIDSTISEKPAKYNMDFTGINEKSDFYIDDNIVTLVFDKYEIASGAYGTQDISVDRSKIKNITLEKSKIIIGETYKVRLVPLQEICGEFGFIAKWNPTSPNIRVTKTNSNLLTISFDINVNKYNKNNLSPETLEAPAEIINGITYVPISFTETFLGLAYYVEANGNVLFSQYSE